MKITLIVNGTERSLDVEPRMLLVDAIRAELELTGTHIGCDTSTCGACTLRVDGRIVKSCTMLAVQSDGRRVETIEGVATDGQLSPLQESFWAHHGLQCGFCTPGMIMAATELLERNPHPTEDEVRSGISGNICRCTGYQNIVDAILGVAASESGAAGAQNGVSR